MAKLIGPAINIDGTIRLEAPLDERELTRQAMIVRAGGFECVDVSLGNLLYDDDLTWFNAFHAALKNAGLRAVQCHAPVWGQIVRTGGGIDYRLSERDAAAQARLFDRLGRLGVPVVIFHPHTLYPEKWPDELLEAHHELNASVFAAMSEPARENGVKIAIETMATLGDYRAYCADFAELRALIERLDPTLFGVCVDTGHVFIEGHTPDAAVRAFADRLLAFHIQDNDGKVDQHNLPPFGAIDWNAFADAVRESGFCGSFTYEVMGGKVRALSDALQTAYYTFARCFAGELMARIEQ